MPCCRQHQRKQLFGDELTALDLGLVLERLAQVDPEVTGLRSGSLDGQPCPSIS
jgi:hypothetical protein